MRHILVRHSRRILAASLSCLFFSSFVAGDPLLLRKPPTRHQTRLKKFQLNDNDDRVFDLPDAEPVPDISNSVPRRLLRPFAAALRSSRSASNNQPEIETEKLIEACHELKKSMNAVGQDRNAAEIERNLRKVEALYQMAPKSRRETLRGLLEYEKELGIHGQDGQLKDPSGAMGLLWIRRSLAFQERMYRYVLDKPVTPTHEAALKAYHETLEPYHGKALQMVYSMGLKKTTPNRHEMFQKLCAVPENKFGAAEENATAQELRKLCETWRPLLNSWEETFETLGLEDTRKA